MQVSRSTSWQRKLNHILGVVFIPLLALLFGYLMAKDMTIGIMLMAGIFGLFIVVLCISNPLTGLYIVMVFAFFINFLITLVSYLGKASMPVGLFFDILVSATMIGVIMQRNGFKQKFSQFTKHPLTICVIVAICFNCIQFFNPNSPSPADNVQALRKAIGYLLVMLIAYMMLDSYDKMRQFFKLLFILALISAL